MITHFTDRNFSDYFLKYKEMINIKYDIKRWLDEKKRTLPDWHEYGFDDNGNIYYRFLLDENPKWDLKFKFPEKEDENND